MDKTIDESYFSGQGKVSMFRLHDENAGIVLNKDSMRIMPSSLANCVEFSANQLDLHTGLGNSLQFNDDSQAFRLLTSDREGHAIVGLLDSSLEGLDLGLPVMLSDAGHVELGFAENINELECFMDIHDTMVGQTQVSQFVASPSQVIDYGIVKTNEAMDVLLIQTGIPPGQDIFIKDNSIYSSPINCLQKDSPLSLNLDESRYLKADLTGVHSILAGDANFGILSLLDTNVHSINWDNVSQGYFGSKLDTFRIQDQFVNLSNRYNKTLESGISDDMLSYATQDYVANTSFIAISATTLEEDRAQVIQRYYDIEKVDEASQLLKRVNPRFVSMYEGAIDALYSDNPDRVRHFSVSFRELFTHIMHSVAPDKEIEAWSSDESLFHKGRPTRKARLKYITRGLDSHSFQKYLYATIEATDEFLNLFQRGTHAVDSGYTQSQLDAMRIQADATIRLLISCTSSIG